MFCPSNRMPASSANPPLPVTTSACCADLRLLGSSWLKPTSRNDSTLVASQNRNSTIRLSAITVPIMATMKNDSKM